jgi:MFS family permease
MLPLTAGFLIAGPVAGYLSDRLGARLLTTTGMVAAAIAFGLFQLLPADFNYPAFGGLLFGYGMASGLFSAPNQAGIMNSLPPDKRGAGAGMAATFQNSAMVLSIGVFFTLIIIGLSANLPSHLYAGLVAQGVPKHKALQVSQLPPVGTLFAAFLGYNPIGQLLGSTLHHLPAAKATYLTGRGFFPELIAPPFMDGLHEAFDFAIVACLLAGVASVLRGGKYVHVEMPAADVIATADAIAGEVAVDTGNGSARAQNGSGAPRDGRSRTAGNGHGGEGSEYGDRADARGAGTAGH